MSLSGNFSDWNKALSLLQILSSNEIAWNNEMLPLFYVERQDESGAVRYSLTRPGIITIIKGNTTRHISQETCKQAADHLCTTMQSQSETTHKIPELNSLLDQLGYTWFHPGLNEKNDFSTTLLHPQTNNRITSFCSVREVNGFLLLPAQRCTNLKYDILNIRLAQPEANKINRITAVHERLDNLFSRGAKLKFTTTEEKIFQNNLSLIDLHLPKLLAEIIKTFYTTSLSSVSSLIDNIKQNNPFKLREELIAKNNFYEFKIKQFLFALAGGMRPARIYRGYGNASTWVISEETGKISLYDPCNRQLFDDMLYRHAHLVESEPDSSKYGYIEKENGQWIFKLNLAITF